MVDDGNGLVLETELGVGDLNWIMVVWVLVTGI